MHDSSDDPTARPPAATGLTDAALLEINRLWTIVRAFSNTAHDVNNALMVIAGSAELLEARELEPPVRKRVETVRTEAARAAAAIDRLLSYSRAQPAAPHPIDVWPVIDAAAALRAASAGRHRIVLTVNRADSPALRVRADATHALQALLDLLLSAEAHIAGRRGAKIVVSVAVEGSMTLVRVEAVSDEEEKTPAAADPRTALTADAQLWSASAIAALMNGRVDVAAAGHGRVLTLRLPSDS